MDVIDQNENSASGIMVSINPQLSSHSKAIAASKFSQTIDQFDIRYGI